MLNHYQLEIDWEKLSRWLKETDTLDAWNVFYICKLISWIIIKEYTVMVRNENMKNTEMLFDGVLNMGNFGKYGKSMQIRKIKKNLFSNVYSFVKQVEK